MTHNTVQKMESMGLMNWTALQLGWERHWLSKADVINHAVKWMQANPDDTRLAPALLAGAENSDDDEVGKLLAEIAGDSAKDENVAKDKWRLAALTALSEEPVGWEEKVTRLEELRAAFGAPADMRLCTRYGPSRHAIESGFASESDLSVDPLDAMAEVIADLRLRLGGS